MPRIDPMQLLRCLSVLLGPNGGILSRDQVGRLASLMTKFSKKLVSKCIYVLILKNTKTELIGMFMSEGGWALTNSWLADAIEARNWPLMKELLELLLMCPVDVERLKLNNCPKLVKGLSKDTTDRDVQLLASRLVAQWLQIVKSPAAVLPHTTIDTSHLALEPHHSLEQEMLPQTAQLQLLEESREDDGHFNFHFPTDSNMHMDIANDLYCDPTDITFDTISTDDLLPASGNLSAYRTDNCNSTMISNGTDLGEIHTEFTSDLVGVSEVKNDNVQEINFESVVEPTVVSEVTPVSVNDGTVFMDTDSVIVTNGEPQEKLVLKLSVMKDGKKIIVKSPLKRKLSEDEDSSPAKRKAKELRDKKRDKEKLDKSSHKHDKTDKKSSSSLPSERRSSKDSTKDSHKSESRHSDSKSKHHHSDKSKDRSREKDKERSKSSSSSSSRDKERERAKLKEKEKKQREKEKAETQAEKDKATLAKVMQPSSVSKLGKIPKKTDSSSKSADKVHPPVLADTKKVSISIENRKQSGEPRPKTVKTPPTKFRSTGLEDVVKPPPSRKDIKKPASGSGAPLPAAKELNPLLNVPTLPERRTKPVLNMAGPPERPGAIKLIPAKPKSAGLQDSDFFMDALNAANMKREPRKRKRRISGSKDEPTSPTGSCTSAPETASQSEGNDSSSPASSPQRPAPAPADTKPVTRSDTRADAKADAKPVFKFYQETLQLNDDVKKEGSEDDEETGKDEKAKVKQEDSEEAEGKKEPVEDEEKEEKEAALKETTPVGSPVVEEADAQTEENSALMEREKNRLPRGVLVFHRSSNKPKKSLKWKVDSELESVQYFELDETERVNVTKTSFMDMKQMERVHERENFHMARRVSGEDQMKEHTVWARLIPIDLPPSDVEYGSKSREKDVQFAREKTTPATPVYLKTISNPDSPAEPDHVAFTPTDPVRIPLDDVLGPNSVNDYTSTPWPEPKPLLIPQSPPHSHTISHQMPSMPLPLGHHGPALLQTPAMPPTGYHTVGGDWRTGDGKVVMADMGLNPGMAMGPGMVGGMGPGMDGGMGPGMGPMGPMGPGMDMYNPNMDGAWNPDMNYGMMNGPDMYQGMDQANYDMYQGGPGFGGNQGSGFSRGRGRGWYRGGSGDSWRGSSRGRGGWSGPGGPSKRVCRYFKRGNCATINCQFLHPADLKGVSSRH